MTLFLIGVLIGFAAGVGVAVLWVYDAMGEHHGSN